MKTSGLYTHQCLKFPYKQGETFELIPFGDVHFDSPAFCKNKWKEFKDANRKKKNALYIGMGDYLESFSGTERAIFRKNDFHESTVQNFRKQCEIQIQRFANEIEFMRGKLIGFINGNHYIDLHNGTTSDNRLAEIFNTHYLGVCCALRLTFYDRHKHTASVDIFAHHGTGAGATSCGRMLAVEKLRNVADCNIFLMGHNHARGTLPLTDQLRIVNSPGGGITVRSVQRFIGRTGSFLRGYVNGRQSYVADGGMPPANLGWISFMLSPRRRRDSECGDFSEVRIEGRA